MKYKRIIILILILCIFLIPTCYAILTTNITLGGSVKFAGDWDVKITDLKLTSVCDNCTATEPSFSNMTSNFDVSLIKPGDSVTYEITIENTGNIDAAFDSIDIDLGSDTENQILKVTTSPPIEILPAHSSSLVYLTIHFEDDATDIPSTNTIKFTCSIRYIQKTS